MMRILLLLCLLLPRPATALTWHVAADASTPGDGGSTTPFALIADAMAAASFGDTVRIRPGTYSATVPVTAYGQSRLALLVLADGVTVVGAGRDQTFLHGQTSTLSTYGITAFQIGGTAAVSDLAITGACFQGINLREASPQLNCLDVRNDVTGGSSTACDVRDGSFPVVTDVRFDGGHTALVVEFGSGGVFSDCTVGVRPNDGLLCNDGAPELIRCTVEGAGRDALVLTQGSQPVLRDCMLGDGGRYAVRVILYPAGSVIDLGGNTWFSDDPVEILARIRDARVDPALGATVIVEPLADGEVPAQTTSFGSVKGLFR
jgi:hypothetical protein